MGTYQYWVDVANYLVLYCRFSLIFYGFYDDWFVHHADAWELAPNCCILFVSAVVLIIAIFADIPVIVEINYSSATYKFLELNF
jgi:hypothetical protein